MNENKKITKPVEAETENKEQEQPKKESLLKRAAKRFGRDVVDIAVGAFVVASIWGVTARVKAGKAEAPENEGETEEEASVEESEELAENEA